MNNSNSGNINDVAIMGTATDAITAKYATASTGYYDDPFLEPFLLQQQEGQRQRQRRQVQPLIKRGTHARVACMDNGIQAFLQYQQQQQLIPTTTTTTKTLQIVVLGAGYDTSFFRHVVKKEEQQQQQQQQPTTATSSVRWYEVDHQAIIVSKARTISRHAQSTFRSCRVEEEEEQTSSTPSSSIYAIHYNPSVVADNNEEDENLGNSSNPSSPTTTTNVMYMVAHNFNDATPHDSHNCSQLLLNKLPDFDRHVPTLFIMECVQMYLPQVTSRSLLQYLSHTCTKAAILLYDPILDGGGTRSRFGQMMEQNLLRAGVITRGDDNNNDDSNTGSTMLHLRTLSHHVDWLSDTCGFSPFTKTTTKTTTTTNNVSYSCFAMDMWSAYQCLLTPEEQQRANRVEWLDEMEEWIMIMQHYAIMMAVNNVDLLQQLMGNRTTAVSDTTTAVATTTSTTTVVGDQDNKDKVMSSTIWGRTVDPQRHRVAFR